MQPTQTKLSTRDCKPEPVPQDICDDLQDEYDIDSQQRTKPESERYFESSTHSFLIYPDDIGTAFLGLGIIVIQCVLYILIIIEGWKNRNLPMQQIPVTITWKRCNEQNNSPSMWLQCDDAMVVPWMFLKLAMILCAIFLQYDYIASLKIIIFHESWWSKFAAFLVLIQVESITIRATSKYF